MEDILDILTGEQLFAAGERRDKAIEAEFRRHAERVKAGKGLRNDLTEPCRRDHVNQDGDLVVSWTYILHDDGLTPLLIGSVVRERNHLLLSIVDRSGKVPVLYESSFDTRNYATPLQGS